MDNNIKVFVIDDSLFFRNLLLKELPKTSNIQVVGDARALEASEKISTLKPDIIILSIELPIQNEAEFIKNLLTLHPVPIILISTAHVDDADVLASGALVFARKPDLAKADTIPPFIQELSAKITTASRVKISPKTSVAEKNVPLQTAKVSTSAKKTIIAIGASTGGTEAIISVVKDLPPTTPGIVVVQHMPSGFTKMYAERLNRICKMEVREAVNGDLVKPGLILIAPGNYHMQLIKSGSDFLVKCFDADKVSGHRPSVDVLFHSVAEIAKKNAVGIILTGMGKDGAQGLLHMRSQNAYTIGQSKESCVVYGMPMEAKNIGAVCMETACENIPFVLQKHLTTLST
ncbi:MAG: chemotaxis-specific protein-glutamate methyltransferase CheB [Anaerotignum sp.]